MVRSRFDAPIIVGACDDPRLTLLVASFLRSAMQDLSLSTLWPSRMLLAEPCAFAEYTRLLLEARLE